MLAYFQLNDCEYKRDVDWKADEVDDDDDEGDEGDGIDHMVNSS